MSSIDPLATILKLYIYNICNDGTKIGFRFNKLCFYPNTPYQSALRAWFGASRQDLNSLILPIIAFLNEYYNPNRYTNIIKNKHKKSINIKYEINEDIKKNYTKIVNSYSILISTFNKFINVYQSDVSIKNIMNYYIKIFLDFSEFSASTDNNINFKDRFNTYFADYMDGNPNTIPPINIDKWDVSIIFVILNIVDLVMKDKDHYTKTYTKLVEQYNTLQNTKSTIEFVKYNNSMKDIYTQITGLIDPLNYMFSEKDLCTENYAIFNKIINLGIDNQYMIQYMLKYIDDIETSK